MADTQFEARLHVLLARDAQVGLVIRRGPTRHVATLLWDRGTDQFQLGQWLKGRIYEHRSDLSPDGKRFIYCAMNRRLRNEVRGVWTGISYAPYLKAVVFIPGETPWAGGGLWIDNTHYWHNGSASPLRHSSDVQRDEAYTPPDQPGGVYYVRLLRDGWQLVAWSDPKPLGRWLEGQFDKPLPHGWVLRKLRYVSSRERLGKGTSWETHQLIQPETGHTLTFPDWEWADRDGDRLVWAEKGKLMAGEVLPGGLASAQELYDFNEMTFAAIAAPY